MSETNEEPTDNKDAKPNENRMGIAQPDPNVPGPVESDTLNPSQGVPPADEPKTEGAPGFVQADVSPATTVEEG